MPEKGKISGRQATFLLASAILPTSILYLPATIYRESAQDSWMSVIILTAFGVVMGLITAALGARFPGMTFVQYLGPLAGRVLGNVIGLGFIIFLIYTNAFIIRSLAEIFVNMFMPETPLPFFIISIAFASAYAVRSGLEALSRVNEIILPLILILLIIIILLISPEMQMKNFTPALEKGLFPIFRGAYPAMVFFAETIIMSMFIPYLNNPRRARGHIICGVLIVGLFQFIIMAATTAVLGPRLARSHFPALTLARQVSIADLIERIEPFIMFIWVTGGFVKVGIFFYCAALATAQWLNLREYKALVLPTGALLSVLSLVLWENFLEMTVQAPILITPYMLLAEAGLPLLLLAAALLRGKGGTGR